MQQIETSILRNFSLGALTGVFLGIAFFVVVEEDLSDEYKKYLTYGISALVALLGSGIALAGVLTSIDNQNKIFQETRKKSLLASKALLPLALSRLHEIAENGTTIALEEDAFLNNPDNAPIVRERLEIDEATMKILKECIEFSDEVTRKWLTIIFSRYQVARSRIVGSIEDRHRVITDTTRGDHAYDWEVIRAIIGHLFEYARDVENQVAPSEYIDINDIQISLGHPAFAGVRYNSAQNRISERRVALGDGSIKKLMLGH